MKSPKKLLFIIAALAIVTGLYFRTYDLQMFYFKTQEEITEVSKSRVVAFMRKQLRPQLEEKFPGLSHEEMKQKLVEATEDLKKRDYDQYTDRLNRTLGTLPKSDAISGHYLLGSDSYHYFDLTSRIDRLGKLSQDYEHGKFFHPNRKYPEGLWAPISLHPYLGFYLHSLLKVFSPDINLMVSASALPLVLFVLIITAFTFLANTIDAHPLGLVGGMLVIVCSPLLIQRSFFGWYDTDPYAILFPLLLFALFFWSSGQDQNKKVYIGAAISGLVTFLFSLFWIGWPLFSGIVVGAAILISILDHFNIETGFAKSGRFVLVYVPVILILMTLFMGPMEFIKWSFGLVKGLVSFSARDSGTWPDMYIIVRETQFVEFDKVIKHAGNVWGFVIAGLGLISYARRAWNEKCEETWGAWIVTTLAAMATIYLSLKTERFALLCVIPLSIAMMWGVVCLYDHFRKLILLMKKNMAKGSVALISGILVLCLVIPPHAYSAIQRIQKTDLRFYYDAWFNVMNEMKEKAPEDSTILSWWPSGYFVTALGERSVFTDGSTQHLPVAYWVARFYFAESETEALGILRMLNASANGAAEFLETKEWELSKVIRLINRVIVLPREAAIKRLPRDWDEKTKEAFLDLTHGEKMPPSYVMAYQDIVRKISSISIIARWDFEEAMEWKREGRGKDYKKLPPKDPYVVQEPLPFPSSIIRSEDLSHLRMKKGDMYYFHNGLSVNMKTKEAWHKPKDRPAPGKISHLYYMENGKLVELKNEEMGRLAVAALIFKDNGEWKSILAAPQLINSILFRMYFLQGENLKYFKNFSKSRNPITGHWVFAFEVDWQAAGMQ